MKLIDLDRCAASYARVGEGRYADSDMYQSENFTWQNYQLDWKALGMIICFVLDKGVLSPDYHCMISARKVTNGVDRNQFVESLLKEGKWNEQAWIAFQTRYQHGYNSPL